VTQIRQGYPKSGRRGRPDGEWPAFMAFAAIVSDEDAIAAFERKYSARPAELYRGKVVVEVGPVPEHGHKTGETDG